MVTSQRRLEASLEVDPRPGRIIDQKGIQAEYGIASRDVIRWCMAGKAGFPKPLRIIGRVYLFERAAINRYFGLKDQPPLGG